MGGRDLVMITVVSVIRPILHHCGGIAILTDSLPRRATVALETHGCKLNQADTQALARQLAQAGYTVTSAGVTSAGESADVFVLNSCTVTHVADRKARQAIRAAKRRRPDTVVIATGCYAQRAGEDLNAMPEVDVVVGNVDKPSLVRIIDGVIAGPDTACAVGDDDALIPALRLRSRAMIKIQEGCDQVCAYCIVPKVRGRERSIPAERIVATANAYASMGCQEVVLTGTQLGSYGFDLEGIDIRGLVERILNETDVPRIRISSLQPQDISDDLLDLWSNDRLCPHFHVPLQSGSDPILGAMRRRYTATQFLDVVDRINSSLPDVGVTADVIVGFPGETDRDFQATVDCCVAAKLASVHVFPYSVRPGTSAAYLTSQISAETKSDRARTLSLVVEELSTQFRRRFIGSIRPVLWERSTSVEDQSPVWTGLTDNYIRVQAPADVNLANRITLAELTAVKTGSVRARVLNWQKRRPSSTKKRSLQRRIDERESPVPLILHTQAAWPQTVD